MSDVLEVKVWREPGFRDGEPLSWRAQMFTNRKRAVSVIGVGPTRDEALADCLRLWKEAVERNRQDEAAVEWVAFGDALTTAAQIA